jgi:hypothetical protein
VTWRAARSLLALQRQLQAAAPRARPPATNVDEWGLIGDPRHDPDSDHTPHDFPGWGSQIVTAGDFPNRPDLGLNAWAVLDDIRRDRDPRAKYGISNDRIFSNHPADGYPAWTWRPYLPNNPRRDQHRTHGHLSVVGDARADGEQPWATIGAPAAAAGEDDDMGASFGPIDIQLNGYTSLTIPPVSGGLADPRPAWLNLCNDTNGVPYALRVWSTTGNGGYAPLPGWGGDTGVRSIRGGERVSVQLPQATSGLSIMRWVPGDASKAPYGGHLTCAIERGAVER